jgi:hypothetical protein
MFCYQSKIFQLRKQTLNKYLKKKMDFSVIIQIVDGKNESTVYKDLDSALYAFGNIFSIEMLYLTIYMVVSVAGLIGNLFSVFIFFRPAFYSSTSPPLFAYLRYEAMIGVIGNLVGIAFGLNACAAILPLTNTYASQWIQSFIAIPVYNISYYAKFLIEILIVVDRIQMLVPSIVSRLGLKNLFKCKRPYILLIGVCSFSAFINYPYIHLLYSPSTYTLISYGYPGYQEFTYFTALKTAWANWGVPGYSIMLFTYIFKHVVTFFFENVLNLISLVLFNRHLAKKHRLVAPHATNMTVATLQNVQNNSEHKAKEDHALNGEESAGGRNMAHLVLVKSLTCFIHNTLLTTFTMYFLVNPGVSLTLRILQFCAYFASTLRHAFNFVQFYSFNTNFRKEARLIFVKFKLANPISRVQPSNTTTENFVSPMPPTRGH